MGGAAALMARIRGKVTDVQMKTATDHGVFTDIRHPSTLHHPAVSTASLQVEMRAHRLGDVANQSDVGQEELQRAPIALCTCIRTRVEGSWAPWLVLGLLGWPVVEEQR